MTPDDHRQRLTRLRHERNNLMLTEAGLATETKDEARAGVRAGLSKVEVAKLLGISRPTLYKILDG